MLVPHTGFAAAAVLAAVAGVLASLMYYRTKQMEKRAERQRKKKQDKRVEEEEVVRIYLFPEAEEAAVPSLTGHTAVPLRGFNLLPAYVNHRYCELFVDCGTSSAIMKYRRAEHLGLLSQVAFTKLIKVKMWSRQTLARMQVVEAVSVELPGGVSFPCTFLVAPKHGAINFLRNDIFLDNATLRRVQAVQCFSPTSSTLFFPRPMPPWRPRASPDSQFVVDHACLGSRTRPHRLSMHVDTGARSFYASKNYYYSETPVEIVVAEDNVVQWEELVHAPTTAFDFILGTDPLAKYSCVLDFARGHLYLSVGGRVYRTKLKRIQTL